MNPLVSIAIEAVRIAGRMIVKASERPDLIKILNADSHLTEVEERATQAMTDLIKKAYPHHIVLTKTSNAVCDDDEITWIIDALNGAKNFVHHCPHYAISIAIRVGAKIEHGIVYDPLRDELFFASSGNGAQLNGRRIRMKLTPIEQALIAIAYPNPNAQEAIDLAKKLAMLALNADGIRKMGAPSLDLAYLACGRFDVCLGNKLTQFDFGAGALLVTESGGLVSDWQGGEHDQTSGQLYAAHPKLFKHFIKIAMN